LTYIVVMDPSNGTLLPLTGDGSQRSYRPNAGYFGPDSFTFKVNDGQADSPEVTVNITVARIFTTGTYTDAIERDSDPTQPGIDRSGVIHHSMTGAFISFTPNQYSADPGVTPSAPWALYLFGQDTITFPTIPAGLGVDSASVNVLALTTNATVTFVGADDTL